jgi:hypothetical protein
VLTKKGYFGHVLIKMYPNRVPGLRRDEPHYDPRPLQTFQKSAAFEKNQNFHVLRDQGHFFSKFFIFNSETHFHKNSKSKKPKTQNPFFPTSPKI